MQEEKFLVIVGDKLQRDEHVDFMLKQLFGQDIDLEKLTLAQVQAEVEKHKTMLLDPGKHLAAGMLALDLKYARRVQ